MLVSVIIPTYRPKAYLLQTLDTLLQQTLPPDDFEVIVVLNGPREDYESLIDDYISSHAAARRIRCRYSAEAGVSRARNLAIDEAQGRYLTFVDDDDWLSPTYLADLLQHADDDTIVEANVLDYNEADGTYTDDYLTRAYRRCADLPEITLLRGRSLLSSSCCKLIPRAVIADDRYRTDVTHGEDALFMATVSPRINHIRLSSPEAIYYRRVHSASAQYRRRPLSARLANTSRLTLHYLTLFVQPWRYSPPFILTRIAATLKRCM